MGAIVVAAATATATATAAAATAAAAAATAAMAGAEKAKAVLVAAGAMTAMSNNDDEDKGDDDDNNDGYDDDGRACSNRRCALIGSWVTAEILGDPYAKKSPLPSIAPIGPPSRLAISPKDTSYRVLGQSRIHHKHNIHNNHTRILAQ